MVYNLSYQYRCIASLKCSLKKPRQTIKCALSRSSFAQMLINLKLFADCAYLSVKQTFEFCKHSKLKWRDISYWCYQILYTCTMYFQGRRNTCNMLRSLKQKQRKVWTSSHKIYKAKMFCWRLISKRDEIIRCIGSKRFMWMCQPPPLPYLHILLIYLRNTNCSEPGESCLMRAFCSSLWHFAMQRYVTI